ncbi:zinc finger, CCHC-type containing protein [Tanacetum coccineum]
MDEPMENPGFDDEKELNEFMDDDQDVGDAEIEEWLMALVTPPRATVTVPSTYEVEGLSYGYTRRTPLLLWTSGVARNLSLILGVLHPRPSQRSLINGTKDIGGSVVPEEVNEDVVAQQPKPDLRKGKRNRTLKNFGLVLSSGYLLNQADKCMYRKFDKSGKGVIICLYVDDMLIFGTEKVQVDLTKEFLSSKNSMKDMGEADVILVSNPMVKASAKQTCITSSIMEYEFLALAAVGKEAEWLRNLILEIPLWSKPIAPISIRCNSAATLEKAYSQIYNGKSRHLGVRHRMYHALIMNRLVSIEFEVLCTFRGRKQKNYSEDLEALKEELSSQLNTS